MPVETPLERAERARAVIEYHANYRSPTRALRFFCRGLTLDQQARLQTDPDATELILVELKLCLRHLEQQTGTTYTAAIADLQADLQSITNPKQWTEAEDYARYLHEHERFPGEVEAGLGRLEGWENLGRTYPHPGGVMIRFTGPEVLTRASDGFASLLRHGLAIHEARGGALGSPEGWVQFDVWPGKEKESPDGSREE